MNHLTQPIAAGFSRRDFLGASAAAATVAWAGPTPADRGEQDCVEHLAMSLPCGRTLTYALYGAPGGWPVLHFHGIPTSRIEARFFAMAASRAGCRLIAVDRPGYGGSHFQSGRRITDWVNDVQNFINCKQLSSHLDLSRFSVSCFSSGAAYALLLAKAFPRRQLRSLAVVDGIAPLEKIVGCGGYSQIAFRLARKYPRLVQDLFRWNTRQMRRNPRRVLRRTSHFFSRCDRSVFFEARNARYLIDCYLECVRCGPTGVQYDMALLSCPWGYCLHDIGLPVRLYYGARDITTPAASMGTYLNQTLPDSSLTIVPGQGHLSMLNAIGDSMFAGLLEDAG